MAYLFIAWAALAIACALHGAIVWWLLVRVGKRRVLVRPRLAQLFWSGLALITAQAQILSLFSRMDRRIGWYLASVSALGVPVLARLGRGRLRAWPPLGGLVLRVAIVATTLFVIAESSMRPTDWYDTLSTHLQQVRWAGALPAIPGLGNLNPKLGFDQAHHLLAALLARGPLQAATGRVVVGFFVAASATQWVVTLTSPDERRGAIRGRMFAALTLPFLAAKLVSHEVASLSGDLAMACVALPAMLELVRLSDTPARARPYAVVTLAAMGALLFGIKFSALPISAAALGLLVALVWRLRRELSPLRLVVFTIPVLGFVGTIMRRLVLTGWPFFPIPVLRFPFEWAVPRARTIEHYRWIKSWAREQGANPADVLDGPVSRWLIPWLQYFRTLHEMLILVAAIGMLALLLSRRDRRIGVAMPVAFVALAYWFLGAPDLRFGGVFIWIFFGVAFVPELAASYVTAPASRVFLFALCVALTAWHGGLDVTVDAPAWTALRTDPVYPVDTVHIGDPAPLGFDVHVPKSGDMCGASGLPCTHYPGIQRIRKPPTYRGGFIPAPEPPAPAAPKQLARPAPQN